MPLIKFSIEWGTVSAGSAHGKDLLFIGGKPILRDSALIKEKYGTSHVVDEEEAKKLLEGDPEAIIIGNGFEGVLELKPESKAIIEKKAMLFVLRSPEAVELLNEKIKKGGRVNALIHSTC